MLLLYNKVGFQVSLSYIKPTKVYQNFYLNIKNRLVLSIILNVEFKKGRIEI